MLPVPYYESMVKGFELDIVPVPQNIAKGGNGRGAHLLEDGFLKIKIKNFGTNPFWPNSFETAAIVLRLKQDIEPPEVVSEYSTCLLGPNDSPVHVELSEKTENGLYGVWLEVLCDSPTNPDKDTYLSFGFRVSEHEVTGNA